MADELTNLLQRYVDDGTIPGAVALLGNEDATRVVVGQAAYDGPPMPADPIIRIQSMTKIVTSVAALRMVEAGRFGLDDSIEQWLPELGERRVLVRPDAELDDTEPARRPITVRHLLTNMSGYGAILDDTPLHRAMVDSGVEPGADPPSVGADEWLADLATLPLAFQPGEGWRYHVSFGILGILLSRVAGSTAGELLNDDIFTPLGMTDTGFWVPVEKSSRLPAAYRHLEGGPVETEPLGGGFYAGPPPYDVSHAELVSTLEDYHRFLRALLAGDLISEEHLRMLRTDQIPERAKQPDSFFPGFWDGTGWGYGVCVMTGGEHEGRFGWSGGQGTDFFVDPDGTVGILLTQVEMGERIFPLLEEFQQLPT